jgi:hypothetical protein
MNIEEQAGAYPSPGAHPAACSGAMTLSMSIGV